jgi:hypothetical protein
MSQAIITAMDFIPTFQKKYKLQVVNTVFLTDGEADRCRGVYSDIRNHPEFPIREEDFSAIVEHQTGEFAYRRNINIVITDPVTKNQETINLERSEMATALIKLLKARTGCHVLGFYVLSGREFNRHGMDRFFPLSAKRDELKTKFRKDKFAVVTSAGFDEYYLLRSEGLDTDADVEFDAAGKTTTRSLVSAFTKYAGNRHNNRVVLNRFIGMIA